MKKVFAGVLESKSDRPISWWTPEDLEENMERAAAKEASSKENEENQEICPSVEPKLQTTSSYNKEEIRAYITQQKLKRQQDSRNAKLQMEANDKRIQDQLQKLKLQSKEINAIATSSTKKHAWKPVYQVNHDSSEMQAHVQRDRTQRTDIATQCHIAEISEPRAKISERKWLEKGEEMAQKLRQALQECDDVSSASSLSERQSNITPRVPTTSLSGRDRVAALNKMAEKLTKTIQKEEICERRRSSVETSKPVDFLSVEELIARVTAILPNNSPKSRPPKSHSNRTTHDKPTTLPPQPEYSRRARSSMSSKEYTKKNAAAARIQAFYRGYKVRKILHSLLPKPSTQRSKNTFSTEIAASINWRQARAKIEQILAQNLHLNRWQPSCQIDNPGIPDSMKPIVILAETGDLDSYINYPQSKPKHVIKKQTQHDFPVRYDRNQPAVVVPTAPQIQSFQTSTETRSFQTSSSRSLQASHSSKSFQSSQNASPQLLQTTQAVNEYSLHSSQSVQSQASLARYQQFVDSRSKSSASTSDGVDLRSLRIDKNSRPCSTNTPKPRSVTDTFSGSHDVTHSFQTLMPSPSDATTVNSGFVPHNHMVMAPHQLSQRVTAELMFQKSLDSALTHLNSVQDLKNLSNTYDDCAKIQAALRSSEVQRTLNVPDQISVTRVAASRSARSNAPTEYSLQFDSASDHPIDSTSQSILTELSQYPIGDTSTMSDPEEFPSSSNRSLSVQEVSTDIQPSRPTIRSVSGLSQSRKVRTRKVTTEVTVDSSTTYSDHNGLTDASEACVSVDKHTTLEVTECLERSQHYRRSGEPSFEIDTMSQCEPARPVKGALQSTLTLIHSLMRDESERFNQQNALLKQQEQDLVEEAEKKLSVIRSEVGPSVRKRQRAVLLALHDQRSHIKRLLKAQHLAFQQKQLTFTQHHQLLSGSGTTKVTSRIPSPVTPTIQDVTESSRDLTETIGSTIQTEPEPFQSRTDFAENISEELGSNGASLSIQSQPVCSADHPSTDSPIEESFENSTNESQSSCIEEKLSSVKSSHPVSKEISEQVAEPSTDYTKESFETPSTDLSRHSTTEFSPPTSLQPKHHTKERASSDSEMLELDHSIRRDRRRRHLPVTLKMSLSPRPWVNRRFSSESDDSFSLSQNETASDMSDGEGRLVALREELALRKVEAEKLKKEKRKLRRERLCSQQQALQNQIAAYDNYIGQAKLDLAEEARAIQLASTVRPVIKRPQVAGHKKSISPNQSLVSDKSSSESINKTLSESQSSDSCTKESPSVVETDTNLVAEETSPSVPEEVSGEKYSLDFSEPTAMSIVDHLMLDLGCESESSSNLTSTETIIHSPKTEHSHDEQQEECEPIGSAKLDIYIPDPDKESDAGDTATEDICEDIPIDESVSDQSTAASSVIMEGLKGPNQSHTEQADEITKELLSVQLNDSLDSMCVIVKQKEVESIEGLVKGFGEVDLNSANSVSDSSKSTIASSTLAIQNVSNERLNTSHQRQRSRISVPANGYSVCKLSPNSLVTANDTLEERTSPTDIGQVTVDPNDLTNRLLNIQTDLPPEKGFRDAPGINEEFSVQGCNGTWFDDSFWSAEDKAANQLQLQEEEDRLNAEIARLEAVQKLKEQYPDLVLRQVPNKPPPPYTPPKSMVPPSPPTTSNVAVAKVVATSKAQPVSYTQSQVTNTVTSYQLSRAGLKRLASEIRPSIPTGASDVMPIIQRYTSFIHQQWLDGQQPISVRIPATFGVDPE